jgi:hypothetical protein
LPPAIASDTSSVAFRLGFGGALARLGLAEGRFLFALGLQDRWPASRPRRAGCGGAKAFGLEDRGALLALGLHLPRHRGDDVGRRADVLDLDAGDLDAPCLGRLVDDDQQPGVDLVALRQGLVEVHRPHHGAQVGGRERHDRGIEVADLIGRLGGVEHLEEHDTVDRDHGIVLGDDLLAGDVEHLLHHVDLAADAVEEGRHEIEAGLRDADEAPEVLDRVSMSLMNDLYAHNHEQQRKHCDGSHQGGQHVCPR